MAQVSGHEGVIMGGWAFGNRCRISVCARSVRLG